jgi:microcystin-dependent protein
MTDPFLGEIRMFSFIGFASPPKGWASCNGQLLSIAQNTPLFSLLLTTYGGDGRTTFALPDLRGRAPMHFGVNGGDSVNQGQTGGESVHILTQNEMPAHTHQVSARGTASTSNPANALWANAAQPAYGSSVDTTLLASAVSSVGSGAGYDNMPPYLVINFCIATAGIFPSRN